MDTDLVIATLHWGPNWETTPSEGKQAFARWLVDQGVDVVHGHSAHVIQGVEVYRGRPILHDCGDFVDDYALVGDLHNDRSFLFELSVANGRPTSLRLRPVVIEGEAVSLAGEGPAAWVRERMRARSAPFGTTFERHGEALRCDVTSQD
jgi:poly-gamma-glutamate synthesis protein (capsule biosynthesis protein)